MILINTFSRERSLAYFCVWQKANQSETGNWFTEVKNLIFLNDGLSSKTKVFYVKSELDKIYHQVGLRARNEKDYFSGVAKEFWKYYNLLLPYLGGRKIKTVKEWRSFYDNFILWWAPMAVIFLLPESATSPVRVQRRAMAIRGKTEKYSDKFDQILTGFKKNTRQLKHKLFSVMLPEEIIDFHLGKKIDKKRIQKRLAGYILYNGKVYSRGSLTRLLSKNHFKITEPAMPLAQAIHGQVVYKKDSRIIGRVRIIEHKKQFKKFKTNDILVTEMTAPDYLPAMKRAKAIITDEGGITCHAAITARELKIPCVIGTKIATKVFKDGDLVEVDANRGIVKKI